MLDPKSPEGALFAQFDKTLRGKHAERLRGYKPKAPDAVAKRKDTTKRPEDECAACADGLCTEHGDASTASELEQILAAEG